MNYTDYMGYYLLSEDDKRKRDDLNRPMSKEAKGIFALIMIFIMIVSMIITISFLF